MVFVLVGVELDGQSPVGVVDFFCCGVEWYVEALVWGEFTPVLREVEDWVGFLLLFGVVGVDVDGLCVLVGAGVPAYEELEAFWVHLVEADELS